MRTKDNNLIKRIYREKTINRIDSKIKLLGVYCKYNAVDLLNYRLLISIAIFFITIVISTYGYILAPLLTIAFYILGEYFVLDIPIKKRAKKLETEALYFFEVLALTIEGGRNLKSALDTTANAIDNELSAEFKKTLSEVYLGKSLTEALEDMKKRIPSETINNTILNITQSNIFGNSIIDSLYNQIDFLREKQILDVKAEIAKLPTKISAISVVFFIPIILLIVLAPVVIEYFLS